MVVPQFVLPTILSQESHLVVDLLSWTWAFSIHAFYIDGVGEVQGKRKVCRCWEQGDEGEGELLR